MGLARGALSALVVILLSSRAGADAVPPPPDDCPPGKVPTTSHGGPACEDPAPTNCPPGYRGYVGGRCELFPCSRNAECLKGERCREVPVCQEYRELYWTGWGWSRNDPPNRSNLLAEPPSDPPEGSPPKAWVPLDVCGPNGKCAEHAECRPLLLCYPEKEKPQAVVYPSGCSKGVRGRERSGPTVGRGGRRALGLTLALETVGALQPRTKSPAQKLAAFATKDAVKARGHGAPRPRHRSASTRIANDSATAT